jgi:hypothetical protein
MNRESGSPDLCSGPMGIAVSTYAGVSLLHAAFDSFGGIVGYIVISILGIAPLAYVWLREDRGLPFRRQTNAPAPQRIEEIRRANRTDDTAAIKR